MKKALSPEPPPAKTSTGGEAVRQESLRMVGLNGKKAFGDVPVLPVSGTVQDDHRRLYHRICPIFISLMNNYRLSIFFC